MERGCKFWILKEEELHYPCSENKGAAKLICAFVYAYADGWFSHAVVNSCYENKQFLNGATHSNTAIAVTVAERDGQHRFTYSLFSNNMEAISLDSFYIAVYCLLSAKIDQSVSK